MKVAFIGTHGVGKTTLCYDLAAALKKRDLTVELVREVARECPLPINQETTLKAQAWILHTQIAWELQAEAKADVVFCDRELEVVKVVRDLKPWKTAAARGAKVVIELPVGSAAGIEPGDRLVLDR